MGVFHPYLTVIEKGMRESNHAINFLLYMATSKRFRSDFKRIFRRLSLRIFGSAILFLYKHICFCCTPPSCLISLERHISDITDIESALDGSRTNQAAYKTSHCHSNIERRRKNQLLKASLLNNTTTITNESSSASVSRNALPTNASKTVRTLTWNPYDQMNRQIENKRQAERLSRHRSSTGAV
jgi:hypothetical protein